jgi:hypothetical protein
MVLTFPFRLKAELLFYPEIFWLISNNRVGGWPAVGVGIR